MFIALLCVKCPDTPFDVEPYKDANQDVGHKLALLRSFLLFTHISCFFGLFLVTLPFSSEKLIVTSRVFSILAMALLVSCTTLVSF